MRSHLMLVASGSSTKERYRELIASFLEKNDEQHSRVEGTVIVGLANEIKDQIRFNLVATAKPILTRWIGQHN